MRELVRGKKYELSWTVGYDEDGKQIRRYETFHGGKREAAKYGDEVADRYDESPAARRGITFRDFAERVYIDYVSRVRERRALTVKGYTSKLKTHVYPRPFARKPLAEITRFDMEELLADLKDAKVGENNRLHVYRVVNQVMNHAVARDLIPRNTCKLPDPPRRKRTPLELPDAAGVSAILKAVVDDVSEPAVVLGLCGMRRSESCGLDWPQVRLKPTPYTLPDGTEVTVPGTATIVQGRHHADGGVIVEPPKTDRSGRVVPLTTWAVEALKRHRRGRVAGPVLQGADGAPIDPDDVTKAYRACIVAAGLPYVQMRNLRHTFATLALERGADLWMVAEALGHSTQRTTEDFYIHAHGGAPAVVTLKLEDLGPR
jgi:integrase